MLDCQPCPAGREAVSLGADVTCRDCSQGFYQAGPTCNQCQPGRWSDRLGSTACEGCFVQGATSYPGATREDDCFCPPGTYEDLLLLNPLGSRYGSQCITCPEGMLCAQNSREANLHEHLSGVGVAPQLLPGYMSKLEAPFVVYKCKTDDYCPGGWPGDCGQHRDAASIACGLCKDGFAATADEVCADCSTSASAGTLAVIVVHLLVLCVVLVVLVLLKPQRITESAPHMAPMIIAGIMVTAIQTMAAFSNTGMSWENPIQAVLSALAFASFNVDFIPVDCIVGADPGRKFIMSQLMAPVLAILLVMMLMVKKFTKDRGMDITSAATNGVGALYTLLFTSIVLSVFQPFICYSHPSTGGHSMLSSPSVLCFKTDQHAFLVAVSLVAVLSGILPFLAYVLYGSVMFPRFVSGRSSRRDSHPTLQRLTNMLTLMEEVELRLIV
eukprot:579358-Amphidinium_carterae.1